MDNKSFNIVYYIESDSDSIKSLIDLKLDSILYETINEELTYHEKKIYWTHYYCSYLYNDDTDYVIDLDDIWKWLGYSQKKRAKDLLENYFTYNENYKISYENKTKGRGGHNKEKIMMNLTTFKKFCMRAKTTKGEQMRNYYDKIQRIVFKTLFKTDKSFVNDVKNYYDSVLQKEQNNV